MTDIVDRLKFDAARCELQFSKGVAGNISEAAAEIERLRAAHKGTLIIKNFGDRSDEWLAGFQAGVDARDESIRLHLAFEQDAKR